MREAPPHQESGILVGHFLSYLRRVSAQPLCPSRSRARRTHQSNKHGTQIVKILSETASGTSVDRILTDHCGANMVENMSRVSHRRDGTGTRYQVC